jgi:hypothetical protein
MSVEPIEKIKREAQEAAKRHSDVNDACPYPFHSDAGHAFSAFFHEARARIEAPQPGDQS